MKKLKLVIEDLAVESFTTADGTAPRGTVQAHATEMGPTCDLDQTCGPETCGGAYCILHTQNMNICGGGTGGCTATTCPPGSNVMSCAGCTTYDYTVNAADDSCGLCASFESESPQRCRCI